MDKKEETIVEHLTELRRRLIFSLIFFIISFALSLFWAADIYRFLTSQFDQKLLVLGPNDILWIYISLASLSAVCLSVPFITFQIWAFVRPALEDREARALLAYIPAVFIFFLAGLSFGFFLVTPALLTVLLGFGEDLFETQLTAQNYMLFVFHTTLPLAVLFEFPVVVAFLTSIRLISSAFLRKYRRYAYFILIVIAVILTPADLVSDLLMALPLIFIYEVSVTISKFIERKRRS
ncbi:twin-arginine translocase subunit TatC [Streptococcus loxodontisalivarius]|uniref:Sec-independent protein translocase protein TatC n=1 Tax=Streptococcus loxodontisalivarius TaxID=1349415 RepID=A0ABS2PP62_9STRE|nr:twin-arginine translocase subunit TatC [Streptococcus loxodontisalivarius]MBM7641823.1 sec-independent protein translocase protein TatC [Streptococcus loxodontisalivarius]